MRIVHLTASRFFGGPERQMLGLGRALPPEYSTHYLSFPEDGFCGEFLNEVRRAGFPGIELAHDSPDLRACVREIADYLRQVDADVLVTHGYKSNLLGRPAARRVGTPIISVARGWTGENLKVRLYDLVDGFHLRFMDRVICVSEGHADKVRHTGLSRHKMQVIHNAARLDAFRQSPNPEAKTLLRSFFPEPLTAGDRIVLAAGRLSPEKGFHLLVDAAAELVREDPSIRFILFGQGGEQTRLEEQIARLNLKNHFVIGGFRTDLDQLLPWADILVLPSFTEGLPNVVLEASAAGIPVVATAVGGTPEVLADGVTGFVIPAGDRVALTDRIRRLCADAGLRKAMGEAGRQRMREKFTFEAQSRAWQQMLNEVCTLRKKVLA